MRLALFLVVPTLALFASPSLCDEPKKETPPELKVLAQFIGTWDEEVTSKATEQNPKETKTKGVTTNEWMLGNRFIQSKTRRQSGNPGFIQIWTFDQTKMAYRSWYFNSLGQSAEWIDQWDQDGKSFSGKSTNGVRQGRFKDKDTVEWTVVAKDKSGQVFLDLHGKQTRRRDNDEPKDPPAEQVQPDSPELKVLERLTGTWDTIAVFKPAEWTPKEVRTTSKVTRKWVLNGRFLQDTSKDSGGSESFSVLTYDRQKKQYRSWWFSSEGHNNESTGQWDAEKETLSFKADLGNGLTSFGSVRFIDKDRHDWTVIVRDEGGKLYFDTVWNVSRRKK